MFKPLQYSNLIYILSSPFWPPNAQQNCRSLPHHSQLGHVVTNLLIEKLPPDKAALYEDEVDIHLNPKICPDYMLTGQQKNVLTPGRNVKHYLAGAMDAQTRRVIWVEGDRKRSAPFIELLKKLNPLYADKKVPYYLGQLCDSYEQNQPKGC